ncbi:Importin 9 [Xenoophorus captivus]|uniref:Importin 9 n=1 Tax=Xenoophorus captivus TaxID=1517983 RepID=A0ABV0SEZ8_9TELE
MAKAAIRELLPSGLRESISKVRSSVAYAVSAIAHWDWPEAWPQLFTLLMEMLVSGDVNAVHGAMRVLTEFTREVTDTQMPLVAPVILPEMYKIFTMAEGAAKALIFPVVQQFTEAFVQALQMPDGPSSDSGLKMEVLKRYILCSQLIFPGEVLGFENLVFGIFEFVHTLLENNKFKSTVRKALPELIYYIILYMQITEDQVINDLIFGNVPAKCCEKLFS